VLFSSLIDSARVVGFVSTQGKMFRKPGVANAHPTARFGTVLETIFQMFWLISVFAAEALNLYRLLPWLNTPFPLGAIASQFLTVETSRGC
jgi:hypothetical protein